MIINNYFKGIEIEDRKQKLIDFLSEIISLKIRENKEI